MAVSYAAAAGIDHARGCFCPCCAEAIGAADVTETGDAPAGTGTPYAISVGQTFEGTISSNGDRDWVAVTLEAGYEYVIDLTGSPSGHGTLSDPYLRLYSENGILLDRDDDGGSGYESRLVFTPTETATYYVSAGGYADARTGTYRIAVSEFAPPDPASLDDLANYLTHGYWQDSGRQERAWDTSVDNVITVDIGALTAAGQQLARWAFEAWEAVADLNFVEVAAGADIEFDDNDSGAYSTSDTWGTEITGSFVNVSTSWLASYGTEIDSYGFQTYVHEIGHAIGLGHQGNYNGFASYPNDAAFANDSWQLSIMSYFSQTENTTVDASHAYTVTAMAADILAVQNLYGTPDADSATAGDSIYGAGSNLGTYLDLLFAAAIAETPGDIYAGDDFALTICDVGGIDLVDVGFSNADQLVDLRAEAISDVGGLTGNLVIARDTVIENATTGAGDDRIVGNAADNRLTGGAGDDEIDGGEGIDTVVIAAASDLAEVTLLGQSIKIVSGDGTDLVSNVEFVAFSDVTVAVSEWMRADIVGTAQADTLTGTQHSEIIWGLAGDDTIYGHAGEDELEGNMGDDVIDGGPGFDIAALPLLRADADVTLLSNGDIQIVSTEGTDTFRDVELFRFLDGEFSGAALTGTPTIGTSGDDVLTGGSTPDLIDGRGGNDTLYGFSGADELIGGSGDDFLDGSSGSDLLRGGDGADRLEGGADADWLAGGTGDDRLDGGLGDDIHVFGRNDGNDLILDTDAGNVLRLGAGIALDDIAFARADADGTIDHQGTGLAMTLGGSDSVTFAGFFDRSRGGAARDNSFGTVVFDDGTEIDLATLSLTFTGGDRADVMYGTSAAETMLGGLGADELWAGAGNDRVEGGDGNDLLGGGSGDDVIVAGAGNDIAYGGIGADSMTGGAGNDQLWGFDGDDRLDGEAGDDVLGGADGDDILIGGIGNDTLFGAVGDDSLSGGDGADQLWGGAGNDTLDAGADDDVFGGAGGNDSLSGGLGDDVLFGGAGDDSAFAGDGDDQVWAGADDDHVEGGAGNDLLGGSSGDDEVHGDAGDDVLWGGAGDDRLYGGDGADRIRGEDGHDSIDGGAGNDEIDGSWGDDLLLGGAGDDTITAGGGADSIDAGDGDDLVYAGFRNDTIDGGAGADALYGGGGDDVLTGGAGDDVLWGGEGADRFRFGPGDGADLVGFFDGAAGDVLELDAALWGGGLDADQLVATYGGAAGADIVLDFGAGTSVTLGGPATLDTLADYIDIV